MELEPQTEYGKKELVELLTGVEKDGFLGWLDAAMDADLRIEEADMPKINAAVASYKANRIRNYGANGAYTQYFAPAFQTIEAGFAASDFGLFSRGCRHLLDLIAAD